MTKLNIRVNKLAKLNIGPRPICPVCNVKERTIGNKKKDGTYRFQSMCTPCKHKHLEQKNGVKYAVRCAQNAGCNSIKENNDRIAKENGFSSHKSYTAHLNLQIALDNGFKTYRAYRDHLNLQLALDNGFSNYTDYANSKHVWRQHRMDYCENIDGRLGEPCTSTILLSGQLEVDHIFPKGRAKRLGWTDEQINHPSNLQTLCRNCHSYKTITNRDRSINQ
jgi:hypothetical protein